MAAKENGCKRKWLQRKSVVEKWLQRFQVLKWLRFRNGCWKWLHVRWLQVCEDAGSWAPLSPFASFEEGDSSKTSCGDCSWGTRGCKWHYTRSARKYSQEAKEWSCEGEGKGKGNSFQVKPEQFVMLQLFATWSWGIVGRHGLSEWLQRLGLVTL